MRLDGLLNFSSKKPKKYIFVSGGVLSGLGKGATAASIGVLLKDQGYSVTNLKCENYLNIDSGNINPVEHGDVFLCEDGLEADLDLGTYERFLGKEVGSKNFTTMGQIYLSVIEKAKNLEYEGVTVDAIPYVPEEVIRRIREASEDNDVVLIELGGTAGEYQNIVYYEAYRIMKQSLPDDVILVHVTYFPTPHHLGELKSKPTQLSVKDLHGMGIQPDFIIGRAESTIDDKRKEKVAYFCNMQKEDVISNPDVKTIYQIPIKFLEQNLDGRINEKLKLPAKRAKLQSWKDLVKKIVGQKKRKVSIAIIAKYIATGDYELKDSYTSLLESLDHASWYNDTDLEIIFINAEALEKKEKKAMEDIKRADGIVVPIGWGSRGVEGKIDAVKYARENKIPYLGLCYGMQLASVEFARNVVGLKDAHTKEVNPNTTNPIIHDIPFDEKYQRIKGVGASMRLGGYDCILKPGTLAHKIYSKHNAFKDKKQNLISERHRHRYEFNNEYRQALEAKGFVISGTSPDDFFVEMIELPEKDHPFFVATQAHPEYKSQPLKPHPIFIEYMKAVLDYDFKHDKGTTSKPVKITEP
ncbi:MAG: CTP synthase [Candidatus Pacebacteria bacterium]|nr:CTP synthase [Candidatus Paceibacterota bacterium]